MIAHETIELVIKAFPLLCQGALMTLEICLLSIFMGMLLGSMLGVFNANIIKSSGWQWMIQAYVSLIRGTPLFVQLLIVYFGLPSILSIDISAEVAGVITLSLNSAAYLSEIIRGGMNGLPTGQQEAAYVLGYSRAQTIFYILMPQMYKKVWPSITNEFIALIKESSILMMLGVHELTKISKDLVTKELKPMEIYLLAALFYFVMTWLIAKMLKKYEEKQYEYA